MMGSYIQLLFILICVISSVFTLDCTDEEQNSLMSQCIDPDSSSNILCNDNGECRCGMCECRRGEFYPLVKLYNYTGQYCNCGDPPCAFHKKQMCGGKGQCKCGQCECDEWYYGRACECWLQADVDDNICISSNGLVCDGNGECVCGKCYCNADFKGPTCEECPTCPGRCPLYKECALCGGFRKGRNSSEYCEKQCPNVTVVDNLDRERVQVDDYLNLCQYTDMEDQCTFFFSYEYQDNYNITCTILVQSEKDCTLSEACATNVQTATVAMGIVTGLVLKRLLHTVF